MTRISRREFLFSLPALALAQPAKPTIPVRALSHATFFVSDLKRSLEFYQGLFGMPVVARQGDNTILLQIGSGPQFLALARGRPSTKSSINHFCMTTEGFHVDRISSTLAAHGVTARVRMRSADLGGAKEGTPELYLNDPDGIVVQLQDTTYCGGAGVLGEVCTRTPEAAPGPGLIALRGLSHFTLNVSDQQRSLAFYQELFAMPIRVHQGATPLLAVGAGLQFIALGRGAPGIAHVCMTMANFQSDRVTKVLAGYGVKTSYVSMRMENRGGAKGGTPELYFADPDGILVQLQDVSYCGGSGYLGDVCA